MSLNKLNKLEETNTALGNQYTELGCEINSTEIALEASFTCSGDTDKLTQKLSGLKTKFAALEKAIKSQCKAVEIEKQNLVDEEKAAELDQRKEHVQKALEAILRAIKLRDKLTSELKLALEHEAKANMANRSIEQAPRLILGKCAHDLALFGSISNAHVIQPCTMEDLQALQSSIKD